MDAEIEAVARAICATEGVDPEKPCVGLGQRIPEGETWPAWRVRVPQAEAAIAAYQKAHWWKYFRQDEVEDGSVLLELPGEPVGGITVLVHANNRSWLWGYKLGPVPES